MRAVGTYIFAGGFTLGVKQHFDVDCVLEESDYGVATMRHNQPEIPVYVGFENWPLEHLKESGLIDFVYGNPPCAAWSVAGKSTKHGVDWRLDPRVNCTRKHFSLLEELRPRAWVWESVVPAFIKGRELVDEFTARAVAMGYHVTYLLHNAEHLGVPQRRERFFFVVTDCKFDVGEDFIPPRNADDVLRTLNDPGEPLDKNIRKYPHLIPLVRDGESLIVTWQRETPQPWPLNARGQVINRPAFTITRCPTGRPAHVVMHEMIHPTESRGLSLKELATLCGYPPFYEFVGAKDAGQIGRGVCPPVGEWLARNVARCLERDELGAPTVQLIDVRKPPGRTENLPVPSLVEPLVTSPVMPEIGPTAALVEEWGELYPIGPAPTVEDDFSDLYPIGPAPLTTGARPSTTGARPTTSTSRLTTTAKLGSGAYLRGLIPQLKWTDEELVAAVHAHYQGSKASKSDVAWNRARLARELNVPASNLRAVASSGEPVPVPGGIVPIGAVDWSHPMVSIPHSAPVFTPVMLVPETATEEERQPSRIRESVDPGREFDKTSLRAGSHGQWVHRDYLAHAFRWGFAGRFVTSATDVLDVGCGPDVPMINALTMPRNQVPKSYTGVDLNREPQKHPTRQWATLRWEFNFIARYAELGQFDLVTNFEMIEHMHKVDGERLLAALAATLRPTGQLLLSTPVFNGKAAANHLHEWTIPELAESIVKSGLQVVRRHGTFASQRDLQKVAKSEDLAITNRLRSYYSDEVLATFLAPLYPDASRNNVWVLRRAN